MLNAPFTYVSQLFLDNAQYALHGALIFLCLWLVCLFIRNKIYKMVQPCIYAAIATITMMFGIIIILIMCIGEQVQGLNFSQANIAVSMALAESFLFIYMFSDLIKPESMKAVKTIQNGLIILLCLYLISTDYLYTNVYVAYPRLTFFFLVLFMFLFTNRDKYFTMHKEKHDNLEGVRMMWCISLLALFIVINHEIWHIFIFAFMFFSMTVLTYQTNRIDSELNEISRFIDSPAMTYGVMCTVNMMVFAAANCLF